MNLYRARKHRAFVGPLGDDIPSIFPIVLGVVLFLTSLAFAATLVAQKNGRLELTNAAVKLAYVVTDKGTLEDATFLKDCEAVYKPIAAGQGVFLRVTLTRFCSYYNQNHLNGQPGDEIVIAGEVGNAIAQPGAVCTNEIAERPQKDPVTLQYPVAVPCPQKSSSLYGLGMANIIVWR